MNTTNIIPFVELLIGTGIIGMLWKMNIQIAALTEQLKTIFKLTEDHEERLRSLEKGD